MLITNFASGELSETLFGRTDIAQYYQGASLLENFDVIPTGGIKRRGGTQYLKELSEGRIIPFVINRNLSYLLHLTPLTITVYKIEDGQIAENFDTFPGSDNLKFYGSMDVIKDVQYAQNYNTMILCHENYPPVEVKYENKNISIKTFNIEYNVTIVGDEKIVSNLIEFDDIYYEKNILKSENNYPKAVSFFNGRLIFAGTENSPQKVFASSAGNIHNFSTYKRFDIEVRDYLSIHASIKSDGKLEIEIPEIAIKFIKPINEYFIDSLYFPEGARILHIEGSEIEIEGSLNRALFDEVRIGNEIEVKLINYNEAETKDDNGWYNNSINIGYFKYNIITKNPFEDYTWRRFYEIEYYINYGAHNFQFIYRTRNKIDYPSGYDWTQWSVTKKDVKIGDDNIAEKKDELKRIIREILTAEESKLRKRYNEHEYINKNNGDYIYYVSNSNYEYITAINKNYSFTDHKQNEIVDYIYEKISETMKYFLHSENNEVESWYYNKPYEYKLKIINYLEATQNIYVNFYTKEIKSDSYPTPDCGFTFEIASDMNDAIRFLAVNKGLIIGTETGEWIIPPGVYAGNVQATLNSRYGSDNIQGTAIGDATCFFQAGKKALVEYYIPQQDNNFRANNMAMMSDSMLRESNAIEFDFISSPYTKLFITREDGIVVTLLYERSTGTFAWTRLTTNGLIRSIAVTPGPDGYDEVFMLVKRGASFFLEVLRETSNIFLDGYSEYEGGDLKPGAVVYEDENKKQWIGYPYTSRIRSMPVLANSKMKPNNIKNLLFRFLDSYMPKLKALPNGQIDTITAKEPFTGVWKTVFPGVWDSDVMFELIHDSPTRCKILAVNAEVN